MQGSRLLTTAASWVAALALASGALAEKPDKSEKPDKPAVAAKSPMAGSAKKGPMAEERAEKMAERREAMREKRGKRMEELAARREKMREAKEKMGGAHPGMEKAMEMLDRRRKRLKDLGIKLAERDEGLKQSRLERQKAQRAHMRMRWGKALAMKPVQSELRIHAKRMAFLNRIRDFAEEKGKTKLVERAEELIEKEMARHQAKMEKFKARQTGAVDGASADDESDDSAKNEPSKAKDQAPSGETQDKQPPAVEAAKPADQPSQAE